MIFGKKSLQSLIMHLSFVLEHLNYLIFNFIFRIQVLYILLFGLCTFFSESHLNYLQHMTTYLLVTERRS